MNNADLLGYLSAMAQGHIMLDNGLITEHEFLVFEEKIREKYCVPRNSIYRDYRLLCRGDKR